MDVSRLAVLVLFVWLSSVLSARADCPPSDVKLFFTNGISSEPEEGRAALQQMLNRRYSPGETCDILVESAENRSYGEVEDLCEAALQLGYIGPQDECLDAIDYVLPSKTRVEALSAFLAGKLINVDLQEVIRRHRIDLDAQISLLSRALDNGAGKIIHVAHSQGNLFANEVLSELVRRRGGSVLERASIVAVATPAGDVVGGGDPRPHTTLVEDFIHQLPGALPPNVSDDEPHKCLTSWECHSFTEVYLRASVAVARITLKVQKAAALGAGRITAVEPFPLIASQSDAPIRLLGTTIDAGGRLRSSVLVVLPDRTIARLEGAQIRDVVTTSLVCLVTLRDPGNYSFQIVDNDAWRSNVFDLTVVSNSVDLPAGPTAGFLLRRGNLVASDGGSLNAVVGAGEEAIITFSDVSTTGSSPIVYREWRASSQTEPLAIGETTFNWGFRTNGPPATYVVTLRVRDAAGRESQASGTVVVQSPRLFFDASQDPSLAGLFAGVGLSEPKVDGDGNLHVLGYGPGLLFRMHTISPTGVLLWSNPSLPAPPESLDQLASRQLNVVASGQAWFSGSRERIYSYSMSGDTATGWPVTLDQPTLPDGTGGWRGTHVGVDPATSIALARAGVTTSFINRFPGSMYAFRPDGTLAWPRHDFEDATEITMSEGSVYANLRSYAAWYDLATGAERCRTVGGVPPSHNTVPGSGGVFSSFHEVVTRITTDCSIEPVFSSTVSEEITLLGAGPAVVIGREYLRPRNAPFEPAAYQLIGLTPDGQQVWRQPNIIPATDSLRAVQAGVLYIVGADPADLSQKLFMVAETTGTILETVSLDGLCENTGNCGVAVGPGGALYVNDRASTRIFRLR